MEDDDDMFLFAQEVAGIKALNKKALYLRKKGARVDFSERKRAAVELEEKDTNFLSADHVEKVAPNDELSYKREGVQEGVFKRYGKVNMELKRV